MNNPFKLNPREFDLKFHKILDFFFAHWLKFQYGVMTLIGIAVVIKGFWLSTLTPELRQPLLEVMYQNLFIMGMIYGGFWYSLKVFASFLNEF